jgi:hypothetical protein
MKNLTPEKLIADMKSEKTARELARERVIDWESVKARKGSIPRVSEISLKPDGPFAEFARLEREAKLEQRNSNRWTPAKEADMLTDAIRRCHIAAFNATGEQKEKIRRIYRGLEERQAIAIAFVEIY